MSIRGVMAVLIAVLAGASAYAAEPPALRQLLEQIDALAARQDWPAAEAAAQAAVTRYPQSRDARLRLAQVALWSGDYAKAGPMFGRLVEQNPGDVEARLGQAQAAYWSGDYRQALRHFEAVLRLRPDDPDATRAVREIRSAARPGYTAGAGGISDDQPYRATSSGASVYFFSDPLTRWELGAAATRLHAGDASAHAQELFAGGETVLPRAGFRLGGRLRAMQFPDSRRELLPMLSLERRAGRSRVTLLIERRELLRASTALRSHPFADVAAVRWSGDGVRATRFAVGAESLRYFDGNRGASADGYILAPFRRFSLGASAAWRDTRASRFHPESGEYDPYWTPHDLREVRAIAAASFRRPRATVDVHLDGGIARDRVVYFGPESASFSRTFHPWRASLAVGAPLNGQTTFHVSAERVSTVFYTANEIRASVAGRF
ncbi:MAG TPA: tetratricopeptide repeat protein [Thermoanaerobaculia bacterium]|jgi:tetratricopeptide (TPR) repeat protein